MTYTINGKEYTEFDINLRCAELLGLIVQTEYQKLIGFTEEFHKIYPNTIWCAKIDDRGDQVEPWQQMIFTRCPENTWPIIDKCWDELMKLTETFDDFTADGLCTRWEATIINYNCTKLVAACICYIEINEGKL
jgi:hypothetical protein